MKLLNLTTGVALLTLAAITPTAAFGQSVNQRLQNQHSRMHQGIKSGELTRHEANVVRSDDRAIHATERFDRLTDHGRLTAKERTNLQKRLNRNSARIYRLKHNGVTRP
jgi:hypothetical protein